MKLVLQHGPSYLIKCEKCGCIFSYGITDVSRGLIGCPDCQALLLHKDGEKVSVEDDKMYLDKFDYIMSSLKAGKLPDLDYRKYEGLILNK